MRLLSSLSPVAPASPMAWSKRRAWRRAVAVAVTVSFTVLCVTAPTGTWLGAGGGEARAAEAGPKQRIALFVLPKRRNAAGDAKVLQSLMREELGKLRGI